MGYYGNAGNYNCCYGGYGNDYGKGYCMDHGKDNSSTFVLIVVLFILLIIVGATFVQKEY
ncbi:YjcZ family sporulation protein [Lysinibacillus cavernae]|uniref:YjcZ family sporulation protein n=1 Tax=Lysinibacillus cavernae TaxID=2666135 RepID=UPI0012D8C701|nr:YjcZ family sporulation protein [Lysinibacillus cavernae]